MKAFIIITTTVLFLAVIIFTSRYFYLLALKAFAGKLAKRLHIDMLRLNYSFDQIVYFISLPSNLPAVRNAKLGDLSVTYEYSSFLFPHLEGVYVQLKTHSERLVLAYLPVDDFRLPSLDKLLEEGSIDERSYFGISTSKLIHPETLQEITDEVFKQMKVGRYGRMEK